MATGINSLKWYSLERGSCKEYWMSSAEDQASGKALIESVFEFLNAHDAQAVSIRLFGNKTEIDNASSFFKAVTDEITCPPLLIAQGNPADQTPLSVQVHAVSGMNSMPLYLEEVFIGRAFEDAYTKYYMLNTLSDAPRESKYVQTKGVFEKAHRMLDSFGMDFSNTIRTWLYASDILSWYDELNRARNDFFNDHGIYDQIVPASTGIGADNVFGQSLAIQLLAVCPKGDGVIIQPAHSPLQSSAMDYKSSFSRGIKLLAPDHHRLSISGTASIDAGMDWTDAVSSLVYFKHRKDFGLFDEYCRGHGIKLPHIKLHADVCRDDLLFELELEAVKAV